MSLINKISAFIKKATVRSDMAKRIMYSLIPLVNDNRIDHKALKYAVEGINSIIEYGTKAAVDELEHYTIDNNDERYDFYQTIHEAQQVKDYNKILQIAYDAFSNKYNWDEAYGGEAWARITKSLLNLVNHKKALRATIENKDLDGELAVMKDIIVEMNIFDGLSHNTASIMRNIIEEEDKALRPRFEDFKKSVDELEKMDLSKLSPQQIKKLKEQIGIGEYNNDHDKYYYYEKILDNRRDNYSLEKNKIFNMMDAKELSDPIDVYREIEQSLIESGDINKYKDYISKLKNNPKYHNYDFDKLQLEKNIITIRKKILPYIKNLNKLNDKLKDIVLEDQSDYGEDVDMCMHYYHGILDISGDFFDFNEDFLSRLNKIIFMDENKKRNIALNINQNNDNAYKMINKLKNDIYHTDNDDQKIKLINDAKSELKSIIYKNIFILESV